MIAYKYRFQFTICVRPRIAVDSVSNMTTRDQPGKMIPNVFQAAKDGDLEVVRSFIEISGGSPTVSRGSGIQKRTLGHVAAKRGKLDILTYLLEKDSSLLTENVPNRTLCDDDPPTILETAVTHDHLDVVKYLVENHNDDIFRERENLYGDLSSPVSLAVKIGHLNIVKYFIEERHVDVDTGLPDKTPLYYDKIRPPYFVAFKHKHQNITNYLVEEKKANLSRLDKNDRNVLYRAVIEKDLPFIKYVLDEKKTEIDINWRDVKGRTLLYFAVVHHSVDALYYLVEEKKADLNIPENETNETPLHRAITSPDYRVFKLLVDNGANLDKKDKNGATALHLTVSSTDEKFQYLLDNYANVNEKNNEGETPLDIAITKNKLRASKALIDRIKDIDRINEKGETLMHKVAILNQVKLLEYLVKKKHAKVDVKRKGDEWTPLHCAAFCNHKAVCKYLIENGADPQAKDKEGRSPAQVASHKEVIQYIEFVSTKVRNRRSVGHSVWIPTPRTQPHKYAIDQVTADGDLYGRAISSVNETRAFNLNNFLLLTNFLLRYLFPELRPYAESSIARLLQNRNGLVPENAVYTLTNVQQQMFNYHGRDTRF